MCSVRMKRPRSKARWTSPFKQLKDQYYEIAKQADPDGTEEAWQQTAQDNVDNYFKDNDVSRESLIEDWTASKQATKLYERVTENITVTEEEVHDEYDTRRGGNEGNLCRISQQL